MIKRYTNLRILYFVQGRIIHEAGSRAGSSMRRVRLKPQGTTKIYKVGPVWAPKFLERENLRSCKFFAKWHVDSSSRSVRTKIRSILQIYVQGSRSRYHASGPGGTMIRACFMSVYKYARRLTRCRVRVIDRWLHCGSSAVD